VVHLVHAFSEPEEMLIEKLHRLGPRIVTHVHTALGEHTTETKELDPPPQTSPANLPLNPSLFNPQIP